MGLFGPTPPPRVTQEEFRNKVMSQLYVHGFSQKERAEVEKIARADLFEEKEADKGIDVKEIERMVEWLKANTGRHLLSAEKIDSLEKVLRSYL